MTTAPDADHAAILAVLAAQEAAWAAGDAAAFSAAVTDDVVFTNVVGMFSVGRVPFEKQHERIFATFYRGSTMRQTVAHVAFVRADVAVVDTLTEGSGFGPLPPAIARHVADGVIRTRLEQVMVRNDGRWQVAAFHNVPIDAAAVAAAGAGGLP